MATTTKVTSGTRADTTWAPNATYPERPAELDKPRVIPTLIRHGIDRRETIQIYGEHGIGKTSEVFEVLGDLGIAVVYINLANITPDDKIAVAPVRLPNGELALKQLLMEDMDLDVAYAIYLDDGRQANQKVQNQFMQLTAGWTLGLHKLPNLVAVVMSDNEGTSEGIRTSEDPAVGDRKVTVKLTANDTGWRFALAREFANTDLKGVFRIWDSLEPELRHILSPRCLEHVLYCALKGFAPIMGLPILGDQRMRLVGTKTEAGTSRPADRTKEVLERICAEIGVPYREEVPDVVRKVIKAAFADRLTVLIQGPPGCGKTELSKQMVREAGLREVYYSMPFTDPEALVVPMPTAEGKLKALIAEELRMDDPFAIIWDEYNRPSSLASFAKLMEATQQWSIAGIPLAACRAQIALCNPSEWMGRKMGVSRNNIAQADRFTISVQVTPDDIPANEWLLTQWPKIAGGAHAEAQARAKQVMEACLEWYKNDIGPEHRQWITKRTLQRLAQLSLDGLPLEYGKIYLGEGEYAPVSLVDLESRLADRPMARLKEISSNIEAWEAKLKIASETTDEGTNDVDQVHQALSLAEPSQLWENIEAVVRLLRFLPPKLKGTFFIGASDEEQKFWIEAFGRMTGRIKAKS